MTRERIRIEGATPEELLELLEDPELEELLFSGQAIVFQIGSAKILGQFSKQDATLTLELAQIDGGGEGVLPTLASVARRYARSRHLTKLEWVVYATACAEPNLKLRRVLERRGFEVKDLPNKGDCYHLVTELK